MGRTWFEVSTRKAHWLGDGPITVYIWGETCGAVFLRASGKNGPRIPGIKYEHVHQVRQMGPDECRTLEERILRSEKSCWISLFWARAKFFCDDWEFYHPRCKTWTRAVFDTDKGRISVCIYATRYTPNKFDKVRHGRFVRMEKRRDQVPQFDLKVRLFRQFLERRGYKVSRHHELDISSQELRDLKDTIRERFYNRNGNSLFEAEDCVYCEDPALMKEYIRSEYYRLRQFTQ